MERSEAQKEASRLNGAKSRGPVTPEGRAASSANSLKHGLLAKYIALKGENESTLASLSQRFHAEFSPRTEVEIHLVDTMILCRWRLHRVWECETATVNQEIDRIPPGSADSQTHRGRSAVAIKRLADNSRSLDLLSRYETKHQREFNRAHKALVEMRSKPLPAWPDAEILPHEPEPGPPPPEPAKPQSASNENLPNEPDHQPKPPVMNNSPSARECTAGDLVAGGVPPVQSGSPDRAATHRPVEPGFGAGGRCARQAIGGPAELYLSPRVRNYRSRAVP